MSSETWDERAADWDERAADWDERKDTHVYASQAFEGLGPLVLEHLGSWAGLRVLDFGAGTGLLTAKLAPKCREVVALDLAPKMIEVLDAKAVTQGWDNVSSFAGPLASWTNTAPFDLIVASSVCSFLPDFPAELLRLSSMLRKGGLFVQWDWRKNSAGDWSKGLSEEDLRHAYATAQLEVLYTDHGFTFIFEGKELEVLMGVGRKP